MWKMWRYEVSEGQYGYAVYQRHYLGHLGYYRGLCYSTA